VAPDGTFSFNLDQGPYVVTVIPEDGTGYPRVVTRATIPADQAFRPLKDEKGQPYCALVK